MFRDLTWLLILRVSQGSGWQTFLTALAVSRLTVVTKKVNVLIKSCNIYVQYRNRVIGIATKLGAGRSGVRIPVGARNYFIFILKIYCAEIHWSTCGVTKLFLQPIYHIITLIILVSKKRRVYVSAVKSNYNGKNTAAAGWEVTAGDAWSVCVYIFYTACGGQIRCSSLFHGQGGWGVLDSCRKLISQAVNKLVNGFKFKSSV